jgi:hypothetical protein
VDVDSNAAFRATFDAKVLESAKKLKPKGDVAVWARQAFTTSSREFRHRFLWPFFC